jgi:hypothetical protein
VTRGILASIAVVAALAAIRFQGPIGEWLEGSAPTTALALVAGLVLAALVLVLPARGVRAVRRRSGMR